MGCLLLCRYLKKDNVNGPEGNTLFYELAERALDGPTYDKIKEYVSQVVFTVFCGHCLSWFFV